MKKRQNKRKLQIGVLGPDASELPRSKAGSNKVLETAEKIGALSAERGAILFTGGTGGVMESASKGAKNAGGITVGIPGKVRNMSNLYVDIEIVTEIDVGSFIFAGILSSDSLIIIPGGAGTLAELCIAYRNKKRCIIMKGFDKSYDELIGKYMDEGKSVKILGASTPEEAIDLAFNKALL